ncbi:MAG TPA: energy-coupling factor transporter transmembrane component T [Chloroflexota bacterium]|nr:energy-coupling factor transporter transmembrane component T [Chloroflexota bacterium]
MPLIEFEEGTSFMHKLDPLSKLGWSFVVLVWLLAMRDPVPVLALGLLVIAVGRLGGGLSAIELLLTTAKLSVIALPIVLIQALLYPGQTALAAGPFGPITREGISFGLAIALRIVGVVAASTIVFKTTDPRDLVYGLHRHLHIPYRFAYIIFAGLRFIPLMQYEAATIREAQTVRGVYLARSPSLLDRLRALPSKPLQWKTFLVMLIANGLRHVPASTIALEVRGFGLHSHRTFYREHRVDRRGPIFALAWLAAMVAYLVLTGTSLMRSVQSTL